MAIKPILFNTEMVRAILDGRKSCTRRLVKHDVESVLNSPYHKVHPEVEDKQIISKLCNPPYHTDDILYVRETWSEAYEEGTYIYRADDKLADLPTFKESSKLIYRPSIRMPKEAARIWLKVTNVRVERLQQITEVGIRKEGIEVDPKECVGKFDFISELFFLFQRLWDSTIKKSGLDRYGWDANPWVWVIEFERCEKPEGV